MSKYGRVVVEGVAHHVTQRGNRRQTTFFADEDYNAYLHLLAEWAPRAGLHVWAYCLMPNHVHLVGVPEKPDSLMRAMAQVHCRYARMVNHRKEWRGHLWQSRFASCPMDDGHILQAIPYVLENPVRAGLVERPENWPASSIHAHLGLRHDPLIAPSFVDDYVQHWHGALHTVTGPRELDAEIRRHTRLGRPLGTPAFVQDLEERTGRLLTVPRRGRPPGGVPVEPADSAPNK